MCPAGLPETPNLPLPAEPAPQGHAPEPQAPGFDAARRLRDPKREAFALNFAAGDEIYQAYESAGFRSPRGNAQKMLAEPEVAARVRYLMQRADVYDEVYIAYRRRMVRRRIDNIIDFDRRELFERVPDVGSGAPRYRPKPLNKLPAAAAALIESVELGKDGRIKSFVMPAKLPALAQAARLDGLDKPALMAGYLRPQEPTGEDESEQAQRSVIEDARAVALLLHLGEMERRRQEGHAEGHAEGYAEARAERAGDGAIDVTPAPAATATPAPADDGSLPIAGEDDEHFDD